MAAPAVSYGTSISGGVNDGVPGLDTTQMFADKQRKDRQKAAWHAYSGVWGEGPLRVPANSKQPSPNVHPNRISNIVDTGVAWLFGQPVKLQVVNNPASGPTLTGKQLAACQSYLETAWGDPDDMMTLLGEVATNGAIFGQAFARVLPPDPDDTDAACRYPRVVALDPMTLSVVTDPDDCKRVTCYTIQYQAYDPLTNSTISKRQLIERADDGQSWTITCQVQRANTAWMQDPAQEDGPETWPHPFPPIAHCQNRINPNEFWGLSDVRQGLIELNKQIHFAESNLLKLAYLQGHPRVFASGTKTADIRAEPGSVTGLASTDAKVWSVSVEANIAAHLEHIQNLRDDMDEESGIPGIATGRNFPAGQVSGITMRLMYAPLLAQTEWKRRLYGRLIREVSQIMLVLGGLTQRLDDVKIELHWQDPLPSDDLAAAQAIAAMIQAGIMSKATGAGMAGLDWEVEQEHLDEEAQAATARMNAGGPVMPPPNVLALAAANAAKSNGNSGDDSGNGDGAPPVNHPAAIQARQAAQAAAGKMVTPDGM